MVDFSIQNERVALPVEIRQASAWSAMYAVPAAPARAMIEYSGLKVFQPLAGRAVCSLACVRYLDGDLGPYHEFAVAILVRPPGRSGDKPGAFIHRLPVNQPFTLEAGRRIWGFPKELMDIDITSVGGSSRCVIRDGGALVVDIRTSPGVPTPGRAAGSSIDAYSHLDGTTRRTRWQMRPGGVRARPTGTSVVLGEHPIAKELRTLGLPKRALVTSSVSRLEMTFDAAEEML